METFPNFGCILPEVGGRAALIDAENRGDSFMEEPAIQAIG